MPRTRSVELSRDPTSIRILREQRGWSQKRLVQVLREIAAEIGLNEPGVTVSMISKWENGRSKPRAVYIRLLEIAFARNMEPDAESWEDEMQRRAFLRSSATAGLAFFGYSMGVEPWQRLGAAITQPSRLDDTTVDNLETLTLTFAGLFTTAVPATLVNPVRAHLETLVQLLHDGSHPERFRRRLVSLASETSILLGWITKDLGDHGTAQQYFLTAIDAAAEAADRHVGAYAIASASTLPAFRNNAEQTLHLLTDAEIRGIRAEDATGPTRAYIYALEAEAHGRAKDDRGAFRALDHAAAQLDATTESDQVRLTDRHEPFFDETRLLAERGLIAVRLDMPNEAQSDLEEALRRMPPDRRIRSRFLTSLATAHLQRGEIDQACEVAIESLDVTRKSNVNIASDELRSFRGDLSHWATADAVRRFDDELRSLGAFEV